MRIVIEIDAGEQDAAAAVPSVITITFPPGVDQPETTVVPAPGPEAVAVVEGEAQDAGAAPTGDQAPGEPAAFTDTAVAPDTAVAADSAVDTMAQDAGVAPGGETAAGDMAAAADTAVDSEGLDAGAAPSGDQAPGEPAAFSDTATSEDSEAVAETAADDEAAMDAGEAPAFTDTAIPPDGAEAQDDGAAEVADTGIGDLNGQPAFDAGGAPADLFAEMGLQETPAEADDLTVITGIGPKIAGVLLAGGISTYGQLAASSVDELQDILAAAGIPANVGNWAAQAEALT